MKPVIINLLGLFIFLISGCAAQKNGVLKAYLYSQDVIPSTVSKQVEENGGANKFTTPARKNYFLYVESLRKEPVNVSDIWIGTIHYSVKTEPVTATPVELKRGENAPVSEPVILVPATSHHVVQLIPVSTNDAIQFPPLKQTSAEVQLTLGYYYKKKKHYYSENKIRELPAVITQ